MKPLPDPVRPRSAVRRLGKTAEFLRRGLRPAIARWLARHDAPLGEDYRGIPLPALAAAFAADPSWADLTAAGGAIRSRALGLAFADDDLVLHGYRTWLGLGRLGWRFERAGPSGGLRAHLGSFALNLATAEECEMIREIHLEPCCYDLRLAGEWDVVDIGGNVGMAALHFARQAWCRSVTSFEPFAPTAEAFAANTALNPDLAAKITLVRKALGETEAMLEVDYVPELRGSMSLTGVGEWRGGTSAARQRVPIQVESASRALAPILASLGPRRLLAKVDCEGSEYGIFRDLEATGALARFSAFVVEWHGRGPDEIVAILLRHGFAAHVSPLAPDHRALGLIYAIRQEPTDGPNRT